MLGFQNGYEYYVSWMAEQGDGVAIGSFIFPVNSPIKKSDMKMVEKATRKESGFEEAIVMGFSMFSSSF